MRYAKKSLGQNFLIDKNIIKKIVDLVEITNLNIVEMDVTSSKSIIKASKELKNPIDILVCNAGVNNGKGDIFSKEHNEKTI